MSEASPSAQTVELPALERCPERRLTREQPINRWATALVGHAVSHGGWLRAAALGRIVHSVESHTDRMEGLSDDALKQQAMELRLVLRRSGGFEHDIVARSFALIRETASRVIGMRHYPVQLVGGYSLLKGMLAEMETGEGKTLTATLAAGTAALAGLPVHIITVNDYLAQRDARWMAPVYAFLGLSIGVVVSGRSADEKRHAYDCDITYCTNKDIAFDYMRDCLEPGRVHSNLQFQTERLVTGAGRARKLLLRGLSFAIVDEADSVLVDEARTPLIISGEVDPPFDAGILEQALATATVLDPAADFRRYADERRIELTGKGSRRLAALAESLGDPWGIRALREELMRQALAAIHLFQRDEDYLLQDGKVAIIDEYTGRVMPDRQWSQGLHQLIELKEGCEMTGQRITRARMTYQRFFRRYKHLAGMTGTAREVSHELWCVYRLPVARIPTNLPLQRKRLPTQVTPTLERKWELIARRIEALTRQGRPVLLGTRSVAASTAASAALTRRGLVHEVLSAAQDRHEAEIIARAGQPGRITIATNMAGRGTDICLGDGVVELGGLHVILSERHEAGRIDRQLAGRCGRHGEPGSYEMILSLEDPLLAMRPIDRLRRPLLKRVPRLGAWALGRAQRYAERRHSQIRRGLLKLDDILGDNLAFTGKQE